MGYFTSLVGIVAVMFFTIFAYGFEVETKLFDTTKEEGKGIQYVVSVFLGCLLLSTQVFHLLGLVMPSHLQHKSCMKPLRSGVIKMERWIKLAAARKAQNVLSNAIFCHSSKPSTTAEETPSMHYSQRATTFLESSLENTEAPKALLRYQEQADTTVQIGGISWVWRRMFNNKIYKEDGVWISPRLGASNLIQWFVVLLIPVFYYNGAKWIESSLEHLTEDDQIAVRTGVAVGAVAAFLFSMYTSLVYIPSSVLTIFRFRSGSIPSLRDRGFLKYRSAQDRTTSLFGSMFWGIIITAIIAWCVIGGLTFLIFWTVRSGRCRWNISEG